MSDYISREALIGEVEKHYCAPCKETGGDLGGDWCRACVINGVLEKVRGIPAADVEPVRYGEWRLVRRMAACGEYKCSVCGRIETFGCFNKPENNPYCHCGAKMDLEDETNDD